MFNYFSTRYAIGSVFNPAPFGRSMTQEIKDAILIHLIGASGRKRLYPTKYSAQYIQQNVSALYNFTNSDVVNRLLKVSGYYTDGEFCRSIPGTINILTDQSKIMHGETNIGGFQLHTLSLLTASMLDNRFSEMTTKVPGLLDMLFDSKLYFYEKGRGYENLLERLVLHQKGGVSSLGGG